MRVRSGYFSTGVCIASRETWCGFGITGRDKSYQNMSILWRNITLQTSSMQTLHRSFEQSFLTLILGPRFLKALEPGDVHMYEDKYMFFVHNIVDWLYNLGKLIWHMNGIAVIDFAELRNCIRDCISYSESLDSIFCHRLKLHSHMYMHAKTVTCITLKSMCCDWGRSIKLIDMLCWPPSITRGTLCGHPSIPGTGTLWVWGQRETLLVITSVCMLYRT